MKVIAKLIGNTWVSFNPNTKMFNIGILAGEETGFLLDLTDSEDIKEFYELRNVVNYSDRRFTKKYLENIEGRLQLMWDSSVIKLFHSTDSKPPYLVDVLSSEEVDDLCDLLDAITLLFGENV